MIAEVPLNGTSLGGGGDQPEGANSGDMDVTFSAPFYTGVFLSSRELQGDYEYQKEKTDEDDQKSEENVPFASVGLGRGEDYVCHQTIVSNEMEERMSWKRDLPPYISNFWDRTVSPSYFIGCSVTEESEFDEMFSTTVDISDEIKKTTLLNFDLEFKSCDVKFYEFGFGSVSISFTESRYSEGDLDETEIHEKLLTFSEEVARKKFLDPIAKKATEIYRRSVPCCIKNSDIWDIDNFAGLEITEDMCRIGEVQEINMVAVFEGEYRTKFENKLQKRFVCFSDKLCESPVNATYKLFTDGKNITISLGEQNNNKELSDLLFVSEMAGVNLAVGRYFNNFFFSYLNYATSEYEAITSRNTYRVGNIKRLKNLAEKFFDSKTIYHQVYHQIQENSSIYSNIYKSKLLSLFPQRETIQAIWNKSNKLEEKITDMHNQINIIRSQYSFLANLDIVNVALIVQIVSLSVIISFELSDNVSISLKILGFAGIAFLILASIVIFSFGVSRSQKRKLHYMCGLQKQDYKDMYSDKEKRNKNRSKCTCEVKECHRCQGTKWHRSVFYRSRNKCFRCNDRCGERHEE